MKRLIQHRGMPLMILILIATLCSALAAGWAKERQDRLAQVAALEQHIRDNRSTHQAAIYGLSYALRSEQVKAGGFESQRNYIEEALSDNKGYVDNLLRDLEACRATNRMLSEGWTGSAVIDAKGDQ